MKPDELWDKEVFFLAREWQPAIMKMILRHYNKAKEVVPAREAFANTYERFFLNPSKEDIYG